MTILFETEKLTLKSEYELAQLIYKPTGKILLEEYFYGNPTCALIAKDNQWAIVAGENLVLWTPSQIKIIEDDYLKWIYCIRHKSDTTVEILTDPWSDGSAIWELDTTTFNFKKIKDFDDYKNQEYTDFVIW